jgi:hypothetical protein
MRERVRQYTSSWSPAAGQQDTKGLFKSRRFSVQMQPDTDTTEEAQPIPKYSRDLRDAITAKILQTRSQMDAQEQGLTAGQQPQQQLAETASEQNSQPELVQRYSEAGASGDDEDSSKEETPLQTKLVVGAPGDKYEQEADSVAAQVMGMSTPVNHPPVQREMATDEEDVQTKPLAAAITPLVQREMAAATVDQSRHLSGQAINQVGDGKQDKSDTAQAAELHNQFAAIQPRLVSLRNPVQLAQKLHFSHASWAKLTNSGQQLSGLVTRLPFPIPGLSDAVPTMMASAETADSEWFIVAAPAIELLLDALGVAIAAILEILADVLIILAIIAVVILLLYLIYLAIEKIVEAIEEAIEKMRFQPPIFWSASLPLPGPIGMPVIRTKPPNPRIPGGGQDTVRATIPPALRTVMVAHHVLPLFLGGTDIVPNVVPWPRPLHIVGHASLQVQPQMAVWGYPIDIYRHPPPGGYFIAGVKAP